MNTETVRLIITLVVVFFAIVGICFRHKTVMGVSDKTSLPLAHLAISNPKSWLKEHFTALVRSIYRRISMNLFLGLTGDSTLWLDSKQFWVFHQE